MVLAAVCLASVTGSTPFDYEPPRVEWLNWSVGYSYVGPETVEPAHSYFVANMLDGDPQTAWMVGGTQTYSSKEQTYVPDFDETVVPKLFIVLPRTMKIDGLRIMPGYNKSPEVFKRNHRITSITLFAAEDRSPFAVFNKPFASARLKDEMGWQDIRFAPCTIGTLRIEINDWVKGTDNDFCISELQLLSDGKPVDWQLTPMLISTAGDECGCGTEWHVVRRNGKIVRSAGTNEFDFYSADPTGRYVFSDTFTKNNFQFYVLDMLKGEFVAHVDRPRVDGWYVGNTVAKWKRGRVSVAVDWDKEGSRQKLEQFTLTWNGD